MLVIHLLVLLALQAILPATGASIPHTELSRRNFQYKLPTGYTVVQKSSTTQLDYVSIYGVALIAMMNLAYEDARNLTKPVSYPYTIMTLNITGATESSQYYRQYASYTLYHALETFTSTGKYVASNFTLQNDAGTVACTVIFAPPSAEWQQLVGGYSGGLGPRDISQDLPEVLQPRQASLTNGSAELENLTPLYASDWYGSESTPEDFFMALATMVVKVSDAVGKDSVINYQRLEKEGYHLNVTNVPVQGQMDQLTDRGVLNLCAYAYQEASQRLGYGINPITSFETTLVWTNGTDLLHQHVLRYEGRVKV